MMRLLLAIVGGLAAWHYRGPIKKYVNQQFPQLQQKATEVFGDAAKSSPRLAAPRPPNGEKSGPREQQPDERSSGRGAFAGELGHGRQECCELDGLREMKREAGGQRELAVLMSSPFSPTARYR